MPLISLELESKLRDRGFWPRGFTAWAALYVAALDLLLFLVQLAVSGFGTAFGTTFPATPGATSPIPLTPNSSAPSLTGWIIFLSLLAILLFAINGFRWMRSKLLWRLRRRLIVTYVFIGVIPVVLLVAISFIAGYLFAGQFASFVVTSEVDTQLRIMEAANRTIAHHLSNHVARGEKLDADLLNRVRPTREEWSQRRVCAWYRSDPKPYCAGPATDAFGAPSFVTGDFRDLVRDHGQLYLRTATVTGADPEALRVIVSEPLDKEFVENIAGDLGRITMYGNQNRPKNPPTLNSSASANSSSPANPKTPPEQTFLAGSVPQALNPFDHEVTFPIPLQIVDWTTGQSTRGGALAVVETRPSVLYARLFAALGDFAKGVEYILLSIAAVFAILELLALWVGTRLTRSITGAVDQLYNATTHVNRADFSHRIAVRSDDQLATLANSFNSMTTSIGKLLLDQNEKLRLEGELAIAQEVQEQLYPKLIRQLRTLEVHGFCRPARTVSGDYYDFLPLHSQRMILAVGDISGKGISAALLMATIYSAVRAYSIENLPAPSESVLAAAAAGGSSLADAADCRVAELSPATMLALLNHQLYASAPAAKYATLFLAIYDGATRKLTYANGGHLPPILISEDGTSRLLQCGGTVVGLFDNVNFPEATVQLRPGDLLVTYSDGVTEPENDYGEFGEERLIQLVKDNRHLPLPRITEIVTTAVLDWIGDNEQPDDVTVVLARAR